MVGRGSVRRRGTARCLIYDVAALLADCASYRHRGKAQINALDMRVWCQYQFLFLAHSPTRALTRSLSNHDRILRVSIHLVLAFCKCIPSLPILIIQSLPRRS